ncbi:MAG: DNA (cytosine-5)-methyltransferase 1 [Saprospiraceae bacterium]|jgi:DNA (cytosine-5)-methyltransferase 1
MSKSINIPVIDLFAGPGGLGEGFSSVLNSKKKRVYDIKLSIEKDKNAHETLELRGFFRQFDLNEIPKGYYDVLQEVNPKKRTALKQQLFKEFSNEYEEAKSEAWQAELGSKKFPSKMVDDRIKAGLNGAKEWVLIGGPPCQAFSLVGRSRVGGIDNDDHRVYLYKEYLRIIAQHHPSVFVMENVKGLLSAKVNGEKVFSKILGDLQEPASVFKESKSPKYKVYSLTTKTDEIDVFGNPHFKNDRDFLIKAEKYGVPQRRHRIILLGVREDIQIEPETLIETEKEVNLSEVIGDLPKIRSGINRAYLSSTIVDGKKKRKYLNLKDSKEKWEELVNNLREEIISWNGFAKNYSNKKIQPPTEDLGAEFVKCQTPVPTNPLFEWYQDAELGGACNHQSRSHLVEDLKRYMFSSMFTKTYKRFPKLQEFKAHSDDLLPDHKNVASGKFVDRFRVQLPDRPATTVTSHISKDGHYFIHYDSEQCRSLMVKEAARM